jgi:hypothetical protein
MATRESTPPPAPRKLEYGTKERLMLPMIWGIHIERQGR